MDFLRERMTRQGLTTRLDASPAAVARRVVGIQAQDLAASRLGLRSRSEHLGEQSVIDAIDVRRQLVRTWLMRATVHLVVAEDVHWMTRLFGPMIERRFANVRWRELGLTPEVIDAAVPHARAVLAGRRLSRHELAAELAERGIRLAPDGQAATHLLLALSARGVTCRGPDEGRETTFALLDDWIGPSAEPSDPMAELARRYFRAFGPATPADFASWSGLPSGAAVRSIRDELTEVEFDGRRGYRLGEVEAHGGLRLLPMFDNYLIGYRDREAMLDRSHYPAVYVGGIIKATVVADGRVIGIWRTVRTAKSVTVEVTPFERIDRTRQQELERERAELEAFFARPIGLAIAD